MLVSHCNPPVKIQTTLKWLLEPSNKQSCLFECNPQCVIGHLGHSNGTFRMYTSPRGAQELFIFGAVRVVSILPNESAKWVQTSSIVYCDLSVRIHPIVISCCNPPVKIQTILIQPLELSNKLSFLFECQSLFECSTNDLACQKAYRQNCPVSL